MSDQGAKPPRPELSDASPAPVPVKVPLPRTMRVVQVLWLVSLAMGVAAVIFAVLSQDAHVEQLRQVVAELGTEQGEEAEQAAAAIAFWGSIAALALVVAVEAILVAVMLRGHGGARWALLALLPVHAVAMLLADAFLGLGDYGAVFSALLYGELLLAICAVVAGLLAGATAWFRSKQEARQLRGA